MKTSYLPIEAPLFLWDTFLCQPAGNRSSTNNGTRLGVVGFRSLGVIGLTGGVADIGVGGFEGDCDGVATRTALGVATCNKLEL